MPRRLGTELCERLDIEHPIVQAPIGPAAGPELAGAVADAGGVGMLSVTWEEAESTQELIRETRERTDGTVGVNIVLGETMRVVPPEEQVTLCLEEGVDLFSFAWGSSEPYADRIHDAGGTVMQTIGSAEGAREAVDAGADIVVAQGWEAGGHVQSEVASLPLVPRVANAVDVPVVSAGGIADGRGVAAVLTLGAAGAWLGTRFVATEEACTHEMYREAVVETDETETHYGDLFDVGWPEATHRVIENSTVEEWRESGQPPTGERPGEDEFVAEDPEGMEIPRYSVHMPMPGMEGDLESLALYAGQSAGGVESVESARVVVEDIVAETVDAIEGSGELLRG